MLSVPRRFYGHLINSASGASVRAGPGGMTPFQSHLVQCIDLPLPSELKVCPGSVARMGGCSAYKTEPAAPLTNLPGVRKPPSAVLRLRSPVIMLQFTVQGNDVPQRCSHKLNYSFQQRRGALKLLQVFHKPRSQALV